ncbi:MAG TPA: hypothetical protein VFT22_05710 [Kofleriaceae bacterium]|nr:hypothetical protein [Kofleriaceae bacterium]
MRTAKRSLPSIASIISCVRSVGSVALALTAACASSSPGDPPDPAAITVTIASPAPGAELVAADSPSIVVSGTIATSDPQQGALVAFVNGAQVEVTDGAFTAAVTPEVGVNHIKVEGSDGIAPPVAKELDVVWAPEYLPPLAGQTGFDLPGALELRLGQRFFDARLLGTTLDLTTDPVVARDVASALELVLWQVNLAGLLTDRIHVGSGDAVLDVAIPSARPSNIVVDAKVVDAPDPGIELKIDLLGVFLAMDGSFSFSGSTLAISGGITADLHAQARLTLGTAADGSIAVGVRDVAASVGGLTPGFQGPDADTLNGLVATLGTDFRTIIDGLVTTQLIPTFTDRVPPLLQSLLGAADQLLDNLQFTVDPGLGTPVTLQLDGHLGALDLGAGATTGHVTVRQDLAVRTTGAPIHPSSRGAARLDPLTADPVFTTAGVHLAIRQDFLNALLHALWNAGLLDGQLAASGIDAKVSARLAPIVLPTPAASPCKIDGERCDVLLELGQVEVELPGLSQSFAINASAGARIEVSGGTVSLAIQKEPDLRIWETSATPGSLTPDAVRSLIGTLVWPKLFGAIGDKLTFSLPLPDLAALGLGGLAPGLASAQLMLEARQRPNVTGGRLILGADLVLSTPPPP